MKHTLKLLIALLFAPLALLHANETPSERDDRMAWWREARFGMFIHWGAYAQMAGVWDGKRIDAGVGHGIGEWIMYNAKIPVSDYAREAARFNPTEFDADAWVRLAREAGQRYIIITAKHHDGFALFHSQASPFNIVDHTPFKRDVLKELAAACRKHDVQLGFYYSQAQDWHHPGGAAFKNTWTGGDPAAGRWDKAQEGTFDDYLERVAIPQTRELLTNYGPVAVFWWDTPVGMNRERAEKLSALLALQPGIITNNRLLDHTNPNEFSGDTETPEQTIPPTGFKDRDFEVCMTMNDTWGYKQHDQNWKPASDLIRKLVDVTSKGGNFLLNVGPDALGRIPQASVERLQAMGCWTHANGEAIYGTSASPFAKLPWGRCTQKPGTLYLHVFDWPGDGRLVVPGLKSSVSSAWLLTDGEPLQVESRGNDKLIHLPATAPDPVVSVIRVELDGTLEVDNRLPSPATDGTIRLPLWMADIHNPGYGAEARLGEDDGAPAILNWTDPKTFLEWTFEADAPGSYEIVATLSTSAPGAKLRLQIGKESTTATLQDDSSPVVLGHLYIPTTGVHELTLRPVAKDWQPLLLRSITLRPAPLPEPPASLNTADTLSQPAKPDIVLADFEQNYGNWVVKGHMMAGETLTDNFQTNDILWQLFQKSGVEWRLLQLCRDEEIISKATLSIFAYNIPVMTCLPARQVGQKKNRFEMQEHRIFMDWFILVPARITRSGHQTELKLYSLSRPSRKHHLYKADLEELGISTGSVH